MVATVDELKSSHELYTKVKNKVRKEILKFIYLQPRNYKELIEHTKLRPGSLYHHLGILDPLITKVEHGLYQITELGIACVENLSLIDKNEEKPSIQRNNNFQPPEMVEELEGENQLSRLEIIWLSPLTYINLVLTLLLSLYLGSKGVAFAGSAIYSVGGISTFLIDIVALLFGIGVMYAIEEIFFEYQIYERLKFIVFIRLISMLPGLIIGSALFILFQANVTPSPVAYNLIFAITLSIGTMVGATGVYFLRGLSKEDSLLYSIVPGIVDLLLGFVILISV